MQASRYFIGLFHKGVAILMIHSDVTEKIDMPGKDYRCPCCNRLLARGKLIDLSLKCPKCKRIVRLRE